MSKYDQEFEHFAQEDKRKLPVNFDYLYRFKRKRIKKGPSYYGVPVDAYNTTAFFPYGHPKPVSKIIDLNVFDDGKKK